VLRGKYLVDAAGQPVFLVDPGVCGGYKQTLEPVTSGARVEVPADAPTELGLDRQTYRTVTLPEPRDGLEAGRYLAAADGTVTYEAKDKVKYDAPKAQLFRLIIDGTLGGKLPVGLVLIGAFLAIMMELVGVSSLPFAVGLYLPIHTSAAIFVGGCVRGLVDRKRKGEGAAEAEFSPGVLMASGLIAGGAITGVVQSIIAVQGAEDSFDLSAGLGTLAQNHEWWPMTPFLVMALVLYVVGTRKSAH
jgi:hypothetical protein